MTISAYLLRLEKDQLQTLGRMLIYRGTDKIYEACTLELPWRDNERCVSCFPGERLYKVVRRRSEKYGNHWHITDIPGRSLCLIHAGNYYTQIKGCVLVGSASGHTDINADGARDVISSRRAMLALNAALCDVNEFHLRVVG